MVILYIVLYFQNTSETELIWLKCVKELRSR